MTLSELLAQQQPQTQNNLTLDWPSTYTTIPTLDASAWLKEKLGIAPVGSSVDPGLLILPPRTIGAGTDWKKLALYGAIAAGAYYLLNKK